MSEINSVIYGSVTDAQGNQYTPVALTPTDDTREKIALAKPYIIPVVFIPGLMGTNLRKKGDKRPAWRPPNTDARGIFDAICQLFTYAAKNTVKRQADFKTEEAEIDPTGPIDTGMSGLAKETVVARGWGTLLRSSYHPFMGELQHFLNNLALYDFDRCEAKLQGWADTDAKEPPMEWGADTGGALTPDELLHAANYQFDVWAAGYNWLQSNADSATAVKNLIENTILPYYNEGKKVEIKDTPDGKGNDKCSIKREKPMRPLAEKVIVVTHSMGGLVCRAMTEILQYDKVMGVIHGVQPATGAPAIYKRMRAGFEGVEKIFLGRNSADVVAILSQAPGPLQLMPTPDYHDGSPWLKVRDELGAKESLSLPKEGDPYNEIYLSPAWYGMIPESNTALMNPAASESAPPPDISTKGKDTESARDTLKDVIDRVRQFHEAIDKKYKDPTYAHYGAQGKRDSAKERGGILHTGVMASENLFTWGEVAWEGKGASSLDIEQVTVANDDGKGTLKLAGNVKLTVSKPDCPGDGTVPRYSGAAPGGKPGVQMIFAHGQDNPGKHNEKFCYDHQNSYADEHKRSLYASMYGIIKVAQLAQWHKK
jgi:hypothetical protein